MTDVRLPDGSIAKFPDGMPPEQIEAILSEQFGTNAKQPASWGGIAVTGAGQGVSDVIGLPDTAGRLFLAGQDKLRSLAGQKTSAEAKADIRSSPATQGMGRFGGISKALRESEMPEESVQKRTEDLIFRYLPKTEAETSGQKLFQAGVRGATGAALTGGLTAPATSLLGTTARTAVSGGVGGVASELGGQLTEGTAYEPWVRAGAGILAGGLTQAALNKYTTAESLLANTLKGYTGEEIAAAKALTERARAAGIELTSAEALAQVKGGNNALMGIQRYAENAPTSGPVMNEFMQRRSGLNASAADDAMSAVAPVSSRPAEVGQSIKNASQMELNDTQKAINAKASPFYGQAQSQNDQLVGLGVNPYAGQQWDDLANTPAFKIALKEVRANQLNEKLANLPDYDIAVLDAVKKRMDYNRGMAESPGIGQQPDTVTAAAYKSANSQLKGMVDQVFDDYATARAIGAEGRQTKLGPLSRDPLGQLALTDDVRAQQNILLPKLASDGNPGQITDAVKTLVKNGAAQDAAELIRLRLQDTFDTALPNVKGSAEQFRGANFANNVTRYKNQLKSLEFAVKALPDGNNTWKKLNDAIEAFSAQGQRLPVGSPTEFNRLITEAASQGGDLVTAPLRWAQAVPNMARDVVRNMSLRGSQKEIAKALTSKEGVQLLADIANRPTQTGVQVLLNALLQGARP